LNQDQEGKTRLEEHPCKKSLGPELTKKNQIEEASYQQSSEPQPTKKNEAVKRPCKKEF
jgi:hypothetical protein